MQRTSGQLATATEIIERLIERRQFVTIQSIPEILPSLWSLVDTGLDLTKEQPFANSSSNTVSQVVEEILPLPSLPVPSAVLTVAQVFNFRLNLLPKDPKNQPWHSQNNVLSMAAAVKALQACDSPAAYSPHSGIILPTGKTIDLIEPSQVGLYNQLFNLLSEDKTALADYEMLPVTEFIERYRLTVDSDWLTTAKQELEVDTLDSRLASHTVSELLGLSVTYQVTGDYMGQSTAIRLPIRHLMTSDDKASETKLREALNLSWHQEVLSHKIDTEAFGLNSGCVVLKEYVLANTHNAELLQDCDTLSLEGFIQKRPVIRLDGLAPPESLLLRLAVEQRRDNATQDRPSPKLSLTQDVEGEAERAEAGRLEGLETPDSVEDAGFIKDKENSVSQNSRFRF